MKKLCLITGIFIGSFFIGCEEKKDAPQELKDLGVFNVSNETDWDYWAVGKEGNYFFVKTQNSLPKTIFYKPDKDVDGYPIYLDDNGLPEKVTINGYIFIFDNFNGDKVDIGVVSPDGDMQVVREVKTDYTWDEFISKSNRGNEEDLSEIIRWAGQAIAVASCGIGIILTPTGAGIPLVVLGCGATFIGLAIEASPEEFELLGLTAETAGVYATILGCANPGVTCVLDLASLASTITAAKLDEIENNEILISEVPPRVNLFLANTDIQTLKDQGLILYPGLMPPDITGYYYLDNWTNLNTGVTYIDYSYNFYNQASDNTIQLEYIFGNSSAYGYGAFLSGEDNSFSVFCEIFETINKTDYTIYIRTATIYSGVVSETGIMNFQKGFIIVEKENDINNEYMDVGDTRVVYESDYLASRVSTFPYSSSKDLFSVNPEDLKK